MRYQLWFIYNYYFKFYFQTFKQFLSSLYLVILESFLNQWVIEAVACNNELKRLMIKGGGEDCCVMIWVIIWATMLVKVWRSMMEYIGEGGAGWSENEVMLKL